MDNNINYTCTNAKIDETPVRPKKRVFAAINFVEKFSFYPNKNDGKVFLKLSS